MGNILSGSASRLAQRQLLLLCQKALRQPPAEFHHMLQLVDNAT
jgi:hypothetical protein